MADQRPENCRIMVVEDEYYLAMELEHELGEAGAVVVGPVASVDEALSLLDQSPSLAGAMLDVNLGGEKVFPVADKLIARGVPFVFTTGYQEGDLPARYASFPRIHKPFEPRAIATALTQMLKGRG